MDWLTHEEIKELVRTYDDLNRKRLELLDEYKINNNEELMQKVIKIELKLNKLQHGLKILDNIETTILFATCGKYRQSIKHLEGSERVNYYHKSEIYRQREKALNKLYEYFNNLGE